MIVPPDTVVDGKSSVCPLAIFHLTTRFPVIVEGSNRPAQPEGPVVLSTPLIEPETIVGFDGVAPVTVHSNSLPDTLVVAVPVEAVVTGGIIEAAVFWHILHLTAPSDVLRVLR